MAVISVYIINFVTKRGKDTTVWLDFFPFFLAHDKNKKQRMKKLVYVVILGYISYYVMSLWLKCY